MTKISAEEVAYKLLKKYWGYDEFRGNQKKAIIDLINKNDIAYIEKTGGGKSIVYQIPALVYKGVSIVVTPLKALMVDQVKNLQKRGVPAIYINSDSTQEDYQEFKEGLKTAKHKMIYVSPERLRNMDRYIIDLVSYGHKVNYLIIDEFDTITEYGETGFRDAFMDLGFVKHKIETYQKTPVTLGLFTATATVHTINTVLEMFNKTTEDVKFYKGKLLGDNLYVEVNNGENENVVRGMLLSAVGKSKDELKKEKGVGIVFCSTTRDVDELYTDLKKRKIKVGKYHGKMKNEDRMKNYNNFMEDKIQIMVCTNAFGRGIDKPNIRKIFHYGIPSNISAYVQEIGRGGRDGKNYSAIMFYCEKHVNVKRYILSTNSYAEVSLRMFDEFLEGFLEKKDGCRIRNIYKVFGYENNELPDNCGKCDLCVPDKRFVKVKVDNNIVDEDGLDMEEIDGSSVDKKYIIGGDEKDIDELSQEGKDSKKTKRRKTTSKKTTTKRKTTKKNTLKKKTTTKRKTTKKTTSKKKTTTKRKTTKKTTSKKKKSYNKKK